MPRPSAEEVARRAIEGWFDDNDSTDSGSEVACAQAGIDAAWDAHRELREAAEAVKEQMKWRYENLGEADEFTRRLDALAAALEKLK